MKPFYVSLVKDLLGYYLVVHAESETAVRQYLVKNYMKNGEWGLPWCSVYDNAPKQAKGLIEVHGSVYEEVNFPWDYYEETRKGA